MILLFLDGYMKTHMGDSPGESEYNVMCKTKSKSNKKLFYNNQTEKKTIYENQTEKLFL